MLDIQQNAAGFHLSELQLDSMILDLKFNLRSFGIKDCFEVHGFFQILYYRFVCNNHTFQFSLLFHLTIHYMAFAKTRK